MSIKTLKIQPAAMRGLNQSLDENLLNLAYSPDCQNIDVSEGILSTVKGAAKFSVSPISGWTIKRIFRYEISQEIIIAGIQNIANPSLYKWVYQIGEADSWQPLLNFNDNELTTINPYYSSVIMSKIDGTDCMILMGWSAAVKIIYNIPIEEPPSLSYEALSGPPHCRFITSHRERIWAASNIGDLNSVRYSNAFDPEDWSTAGQAGEIKLETFDGDYIQNLMNVFDDVIISKNNTIWKITGDIPSEYAVEQVYATQGVVYQRGMCTDGNLCFYAGSDGIYQYDGVSSTPILTSEIKDIYSLMDDVICHLVNNRLYVFDGKRNKTTNYVGKCIIYDAITKKAEVHKSTDIYDATTSEQLGKGKYYYTDGNLVYRIDSTKLKFGDNNIAAYWITPETDFGYPNASKTLTDIYFTGWGTTAAGAAGGQVKITAYYNQSGEQRTKEKIVTLQTTKKVHTVPFLVTGRLFKFKIENVDGSAINVSKPTFIFELDED